MISRIEAFKYRCFDHLDIKMANYHVLAGPNGSGKTTLLDIPGLLGDMLRRGVAPAFLEAPLAGGIARSQSLQELIFHKLGNYFAFAVEFQLPEFVQIELLNRTPSSTQNDERKHPIGLRYEVGFEVFNYVELHVQNEFLSITPRDSAESETGWGIGGKTSSDLAIDYSAGVRRTSNPCPRISRAKKICTKARAAGVSFSQCAEGCRAVSGYGLAARLSRT